MGFLSRIGIMGGTTAVFSTAGAAFGGAMGGAGGAIEGAKLGGAMGIQAAALIKSEQAIDAIGTKAGAAADKTGEKMLEIADRVAVCVEKLAESWATLFLIGYATSIAFNGTSFSSEHLAKFCTDGVLSSINCFSMNITNISFNTVATASALALGKQIFNMVSVKK